MRGSTRGELDVHEIFTSIVESIAADTMPAQRKVVIHEVRQKNIFER